MWLVSQPLSTCFFVSLFSFAFPWPVDGNVVSQFFLKSVGFSRVFFSVCCARGVPCTSVFRKSDTWGVSLVVSWVLSIFSPATIICARMPSEAQSVLCHFVIFRTSEHVWWTG